MVVCRGNTPPQTGEVRDFRLHTKSAVQDCFSAVISRLSASLDCFSAVISRLSASLLSISLKPFHLLLFSASFPSLSWGPPIWSRGTTVTLDAAKGDNGETVDMAKGDNSETGHSKGGQWGDCRHGKGGQQ